MNTKRLSVGGVAILAAVATMVAPKSTSPKPLLEDSVTDAGAGKYILRRPRFTDGGRIPRPMDPMCLQDAGRSPQLERHCVARALALEHELAHLNDPILATP